MTVLDSETVLASGDEIVFSITDSLKGSNDFVPQIVETISITIKNDIKETDPLQVEAISWSPILEGGAYISTEESGGKQEKIVQLPDAIEKVEISFNSMGEITEWELNVGDDIEEWTTWVNNRLLKHISFDEGNSPGDFDGGESYSFVINDDEMSFSYVMNGNDKHYLLWDNEWYQVENPKSPF